MNLYERGDIEIFEPMNGRPLDPVEMVPFRLLFKAMKRLESLIRVIEKNKQ